MRPLVRAEAVGNLIAVAQQFAVELGDLPELRAHLAAAASAIAEFRCDVIRGELRDELRDALRDDDDVEAGL